MDWLKKFITKASTTASKISDFTDTKEYLIMLTAATGFLIAINHITDNLIQRDELQEEQLERARINYLKSKLPQRVLSKYGLKK